VLVFVDESNVVSSVRALGRKLDWLKLRDHLVSTDRGRELIEMVIYAGLPPPIPEWQTEREKKNKFLHWLRSNGFLVMAKDGSPGDGKHYKANVDVLMAIDAVELSVEIRPEVVVLVTAMLILHIWLCSYGGVGFAWKWPLPLKRWVLD
jgi:uncharacterized LabA/DUF88 family protein